MTSSDIVTKCKEGGTNGQCGMPSLIIQRKGTRLGISRCLDSVNHAVSWRFFCVLVCIGIAQYVKLSTQRRTEVIRYNLFACVDIFLLLLRAWVFLSMTQYNLSTLLIVALQKGHVVPTLRHSVMQS